MGGYGGSFTAWLRSSDPKPYYSFGNGAAMRVSPVGWAFDSEADTLRFAMLSAECTHNHPEGLIGASLVARAIFRMRHGELNRPETIHLVQEYYGDLWDTRLPARWVFDETCQGCVPLAFHILLQSHSFESALRLAVAYGGDSDTLAAIVGSLAEARYGIPDDIKKRALEYLSEDIRYVIFCFSEKYGYDYR